MTQIHARDRRRNRHRMRPDLMMLEGRQLLATFTVTNTSADSTIAGSLPWAVGQANGAGGTQAIVFDQTAFSKPQTITLTGTQLELSTAKESVTITGPSAGVTVSGGGLSRVFQVDSMVSASISGLTITGGKADNSGGGGILDYQGTIALTGCTITGNSAPFAGGGIRVYFGTATLTNCTISGNSSGGGGGGLRVGGGSTATLTNCTISGNSNSSGLAAYGTVALTNTIVAGNASGDIVGGVTGTNNLTGTGGSGGLVNGVAGNIVGVANPGLSPLGSYGGPTQTVALLPGSPAIDAGINTPGVPATDQRGLARFGATDIGAFESQGFKATIVPGSSPQSAKIGTAFAHPLAFSVTANNPVEPVNGGVVTFVAHPSASGASAIFDSSTGVVTNGVAAVTAAPNNVPGSYTVVPALAGSPVSFALTNIGPAFAKLVVNTTSDYFAPGAGLLSLREAVDFENASTTGNAPITFDGSKGGAFSVPRTITLGGSPLELSDAVGTASITGPKAGLTLSGGGRSRVLQVDAKVTASITGLTITGGKADYGGGVLNDGTTTLTGCTVDGNAATVAGGGLASFSGAINLVNCTVTGNSASQAGGGLELAGGTASLINTTVSDNSAISTGAYGYVFGSGGGLDVRYGTAATLTNCTVIGNSTGKSGGGIANAGSTTLNDCTLIDNNVSSFGTGGGLDNRNSATLTNCTVSGNSAENGAGVFNAGTATLTDCTIKGNTANDQGYGYGGGLTNFGNASLIGCTISGNSAAGQGGGVLSSASFYFLNYSQSTTLTDCTISGNVAGTGGGVETRGQADVFYYNQQTYVLVGYATTIMNGCTVSGNSASANGGGMDTGAAGTTTATNTKISGNFASSGGGASSTGFSVYGLTFGGTTDLSGCTVSGNTASANGGGLFNDAFSTTALTGTTVNGNSAAVGGGIASQGTLAVDSGTINKNTATSKGGGISATGGTATITNSSINNNQVNAPTGGTALGGGIDSEQTTLSLSNDTVNSNQANGATAFGGGLYLLDGSADIEDTTINSNQANGSVLGVGGGIYDDGGQLKLGGTTTLKKNKASTYGSDLFVK